ncbi:MAG: hypothetical protein LIO93_10615 [Bacteroidales bacterium]|nr:hypothetical protein [Bacteroidales bacterium]
MDLNTIPSTGKWSDASAAINENFNKTNIEIEKLKIPLSAIRGISPQKH